MSIPNYTHQTLSNVFADLINYWALFSSAAGTTGANEASGGGYARQAAGASTPDGVGDSTFSQVTVPAASGNYSEGGGFSTLTGLQLATPSGLAVSAATGGSLTSGTTVYYKIVGFNFAGQTVASTEVSFTPSGSNLSGALTWSALTGVSGLTGLAAFFAGFQIFRGLTSGGENILVATVANTATSYTDTGAAGTSATPPVTNTAATFVGSNAFQGGTVSVVGTGASVDIAPSVTA